MDRSVVASRPSYLEVEPVFRPNLSFLLPTTPPIKTKMPSLSRYLRRARPSSEDGSATANCKKENREEHNKKSMRRNKPTSSTSAGPKLSDLISYGEWDAVREMMSGPNARFIVRACSYPKDDRSNASGSAIDIHDNALHYACLFYPPFDVVKLIHMANPEYITQVDSAGRTVLHTAIRYGSDPRTIRYICAKYPSAAGALDLANQTPFHYLCRYYAESHDLIKSGGGRTNCMREITRALFAHSPKQTVNVEDEDGCTALERAIETDAPYKMVKFLQKACETDWREASDSSGLDHESLKQVLHDQAIKSQRKLSMEIEKSSRRSSSNSSLFDITRSSVPSRPSPTRRTSWVPKQA